MKSSGIVKRIDGFGCITVPRKIQEVCGIKGGDLLEIYYDEKGRTVTFKRYETDVERRKKWINKWHEKFSRSGATSKRVGNMTIVSRCCDIATTTCHKGDTYDRKVGEAICMAKLCGEHIPEYI